MADKAAASGLMPHEFLLAVVRGEAIDGTVPTFADRLDAAKAAAPYFAPKLAAVEMTTRIKRSLADYSSEELLAMISDGDGVELKRQH